MTTRRPIRLISKAACQPAAALAPARAPPSGCDLLVMITDLGPAQLDYQRGGRGAGRLRAGW